VSGYKSTDYNIFAVAACGRENLDLAASGGRENPDCAGAPPSGDLKAISTDCYHIRSRKFGPNGPGSVKICCAPAGGRRENLNFGELVCDLALIETVHLTTSVLSLTHL
jgi:hypothetical protein